MSVHSNWNYRNIRLPRWWILLASMALIMAFQNFSVVDGWKINLIPINEKVRSHHAKELLGSGYTGSNAQRVEGATSLGVAIFNDVYHSLPKKFKNHSVDLASTILTESEKYEIDPVFVVAIIKTESSFNPVIRGRFGEIGLMQLKPDTAQWIAKKYKIKWSGSKDLENPSKNVRLGLAYMDWLRDKFNGHANKYLSAYNAGAARVCRMYASEIKPREYSMRVMRHYSETYGRLADATTLSLLTAGN
ncbi:MAG: lytic transglycosylase domain-containing protein [Bdellovibrio sp. CG10_big_fil_rev_8_21_14_0_10_47_8]|nr:MAG: lytic transglycosylase domain-containing protein [Bdellovibrio sp. CG10_big_fil_rev_8_21_14_0_10_47_8]